MNGRQQQILEAVIREYADTAQPVSSGVLYKKYKLGASPATIRAEMKKLEEEGYLYQPHTSAGRIPTDRGYRFFINSLMRSRELTLREQKTVQQNILRNKKISHLMPRIANLLADMSSNLAISGLWDFEEPEFYKAGIGRLLQEPELNYGNQLAKILDYLDRNIEELFDIVRDETIGIYVGEENPIRQMKGLSMIVSGQRMKSGRGLIAILGPRRMRYDRNIALIEYFNKLLEEL